MCKNVELIKTGQECHHSGSKKVTVEGTVIRPPNQRTHVLNEGCFQSSLRVGNYKRLRNSTDSFPAAQTFLFSVVLIRQSMVSHETQLTKRYFLSRCIKHLSK